MSSLPEEIAAVLRRRGAVIDVPGTKALYTPLLAHQDRTGVECTLDIPYGDGPRHRLDIYRPRDSTAATPVLVFIHGGGFVRGDKGERANLAVAFVREGFTVVLPNYRLGPESRWPAGAEDVASVLRWVRSHIGKYGGDGARVVLAGESAGATHAATCALVNRLGPGADAFPLGVALVSGGGYDPALEGLARAQFGIATPDPRNEAYFGPDPDAWPGMAIVDLADASPFPVFLSYAELDPAQMQVQAGALFAHLVRKLGFAPTLRVIRGHDHLSQLYSIGTGDVSLLQPLLAWMRALPGMQRP